MSDVNADQRTFWTDQAGPKWINRMAALDAKLSPVLDGVLERAALRAGDRVLDVGCGAGSSTLRAGDLVGSTGLAVGADISQTLLDAARQRAVGLPQVRFEQVDAQTHAFAPETFDCLMSRFGVMFFEDTKLAFANMTRALRPGGRLSFATWGPIPENPFFTLPAQVARREIGPVPKSDPDAPGPFALRDTDLVCGYLESAGLDDIAAEEVKLALTPVGDARAVATLMCDIGPAHSALAHYEVDAAGRGALIDSLSAALAPFETDAGLRIPACINFFTARKPA